MARRKTLPESIRAKLALSERLACLRLELFGERGGPEMARRLGIPVRTWYNYEGGVTVPAEVVLKIIEVTSVEPSWLLHGKGPRFRNHPQSGQIEASARPATTVGALLRTALQLLESNGEESGRQPADHSLEAPPTATARREWIEAQQDNRCVEVKDDAMAPILADGARVAYSKQEEDPKQLDGKLVVVWLNNEPTIRWFQDCGRYAMLRAENPETRPQEQIVDLDAKASRPRLHRVLWIDSPHH